MTVLATLRGRPLPPGEAARKAVHAAMGLFVLALPFLTPLQALFCAAAALLHNWLVLPRLVGHRMRSAREGASDRGVLLYPVIVGVLVLVFWRDLSAAAAGWGFLAWGDAAAGLVGMRWGRRALPWNARKTWAGLTGAFFGALVGGWCAYAAFVTRVFTLPAADGFAGNPLGPEFVARLAAAALIFALVEGAPLAVDDNVLAPLLAALVLAGMGSPAAERGLSWAAWSGQAAVALGANAACAVLAAWKRVLSPAGIAGAFLLGWVTWTFGGKGLWFVLLVFLAIGTAVTRVGWAKKAAAGIAETHGGRRGLGNVAAKGAVVFVASTLAPFAARELAVALAVAALVAALADTVGSEIGKAYGRRAFLLPNLRRVPVGTPGAVSWAGTVASLAAATLLAGLAGAVAVLPWRAAWLCGGVGFAAALIEGRFAREVGHDAVNLTLTLVAAAAAGAILVGLRG